MRLVHLSDIHVQVDYRGVMPWKMGWRRTAAQFELQLRHRAERYDRAVHTLGRLARDFEALKADHVLLTGDLTCLAVAKEFEDARRSLAPFTEDPKRLSVIPGNHDRYTRGATRTRRFETHFGHLLKSDLPGYALETGYPFVRLVGDAVAVVGLDTTRVAPLPGLAFGAVGKRQLRALGHILEDRKIADRFVCVLIHHAPRNQHGRPDRPTHGLIDAGPLMKLLAGKNAALFHGHIHHRYWHKANAEQPHMFGAGSSTMAGDEGFWVLELEGNQLKDARMMRPGEAGG